MQQKTKNILLVLGFIVMLFLAFKLGISKTLELKREVVLLESEVTTSSTIKTSLDAINQKERMLDSILVKNNIKNISVQNNLLAFLNTESQNSIITISSFREPHTFTEEDYSITSYQFSLKGDFYNILDIAYALEQNYNLGNIVHLSFNKKMDYRKRREFLEVDFLLESFVADK